MSFLSNRVTTWLGVAGLVLGALAGSDQLPPPFREIVATLAGIVAVVLGKTHPGTDEATLPPR